MSIYWFVGSVSHIPQIFRLTLFQRSFGFANIYSHIASVTPQAVNEIPCAAIYAPLHGIGFSIRSVRNITFNYPGAVFACAAFFCRYQRSVCLSVNKRITDVHVPSEGQQWRFRKDILHSFQENVRKRGYSGRSIETQLQKVDRMDKLQLLQKGINRQKTDRVLQVLTYSKYLPDIRAILRKHHDTLFT